MLDKLNWLRLTSLITLVLLTWKWIGLFLRKNRLLKCWGLTFFLNWIGALRKIASKKIGAFIYSKKLLSAEVALYLNKSTIWWCVEYLCHVCTGASCCYVELLDKLQKQICQTVGPSLVASLETLACHQSVASLSLFYRCYFGRCLSELAHLVPVLCSRGRSNGYSDKLHDFSVTFLRCYKDVHVNSFFHHTARLWNSLPTEHFPLIYDLDGFMSRINRYILTVGSF